MDWKKITQSLYWLFTAKKSGLVHDTEEELAKVFKFEWLNDLHLSELFKTEWLGASNYVPKHVRLSLSTMDVKTQYYQTCQWNATAEAKQQDEGVILSPRGMCIWARRNGLVGQDGVSSLVAGEKALQQWGCTEEGLINDIFGAGDSYNWDNYSIVDDATFAKLTANAATHKTKSYWNVCKRGDILALLDQGRILKTGIDWYTGFNQNGGFKYPWIISKIIGWLISGHSINITGYDLNYKGFQVYELLTSWGSSWGLNGRFYISMDYFDKHNYGIYTNLDLDPGIGKILRDYKYVKGDQSPDIYAIQNGLKCKIMNWETFVDMIKPGDPAKSFTTFPQNLINQIPSGNDIQ